MGFLTPNVINEEPLASLPLEMGCSTSFKYFHCVGFKKFSLAIFVLQISALDVEPTIQTSGQLPFPLCRHSGNYFSVSLKHNLRIKLHWWQQFDGQLLWIWGMNSGWEEWWLQTVFLHVKAAHVVGFPTGVCCVVVCHCWGISVKETRIGPSSYSLHNRQKSPAGFWRKWLCGCQQVRKQVFRQIFIREKAPLMGSTVCQRQHFGHFAAASNLNSPRK